MILKTVIIKEKAKKKEISKKVLKKHCQPQVSKVIDCHFREDLNIKIKIRYKLLLYLDLFLKKNLFKG